MKYAQCLLLVVYLLVISEGEILYLLSLNFFFELCMCAARNDMFPFKFISNMHTLCSLVFI